ncbi:hypothetical protein [Shewanella sp. 125m-1]
MKSNDINDFVEQFDSQLIKVDENNKVMLVDIVLGIKEVVYLKSKRGHKIIRRMAKSLALRLSQKGVEEICEELEAVAFDLESEPIKHHKRYALSKDGISTEIDMCNGSVVQVSPGKAEIIDHVPDSYFMRPDFQQPTVMPNLGLSNKQIPAALKDLRSFINTDDVTYFILVGYITYLLATPKAKGLPYPILVIQGDKGSGKSFFCNNIIRGVVDPSTMSGVALTKKNGRLRINFKQYVSGCVRQFTFTH